jgi:hypothetical protein
VRFTSFYSSFPPTTREDTNVRRRNAQTRRLASQRAQDSSRHFPCFPRRRCYGFTRRLRPLADSLRRPLLRTPLVLPSSSVYRLTIRSLQLTIPARLSAKAAQRVQAAFSSSFTTVIAFWTGYILLRRPILRFVLVHLAGGWARCVSFPSPLTVVQRLIPPLEQSSPLVRDALQWCLLGDSCGKGGLECHLHLARLGGGAHLLRGLRYPGTPYGPLLLPPSDVDPLFCSAAHHRLAVLPVSEPSSSFRSSFFRPLLPSASCFHPSRILSDVLTLFSCSNSLTLNSPSSLSPTRRGVNRFSRTSNRGARPPVHGTRFRGSACCSSGRSCRGRRDEGRCRVRVLPFLLPLPLADPSFAMQDVLFLMGSPNHPFRNSSNPRSRLPIAPASFPALSSNRQNLPSSTSSPLPLRTASPPPLLLSKLSLPPRRLPLLKKRSKPSRLHSPPPLPPSLAFPRSFNPPPSPPASLPPSWITSHPPKETSTWTRSRSSRLLGSNRSLRSMFRRR